ncbi:MAG: DNA polymerase IV [Planctomycetota bacterium]|nr:DNA polymerase IV [Planctomycetota bacterium]
MGTRTILHADMDAFYAAIEQRDRPELRDQPVIIGGHQPRQVVATASYEARKFGVHSAMPGVRARQLCPQGIFVAPRMEVYSAVSRQIMEVFASYTDLVEPLSLDEAFLDVTGSRQLFGDGETIARRIKQDVLAATQLTVSVGVASSKFLAKVASDLDKPDGLVVVPPTAEPEFLAPLPVSCLWGAGPVLQRKLTGRGMRTIGDVQRRSREQLVAAFGEATGEHLFALANNRDTREVQPERVARSLGHELTFSEDLRTPEQARAVLLQLAQQVGRRLRQQGLRGRTVRLKLRMPDFQTTTRQCRVAATQDDLVLFESAAKLLDGAWDRSSGIRLLGVTAADLVDAADAAQGSLFGEQAEDKRTRVLEAMDAIRDRHGEQAVRRGPSQQDGSKWGPGL